MLPIYCNMILGTGKGESEMEKEMEKDAMSHNRLRTGA